MEQARVMQLRCMYESTVLTNSNLTGSIEHYDSRRSVHTKSLRVHASSSVPTWQSC
jgi:hypothetical protein